MAVMQYLKLLIALSFLTYANASTADTQDENTVVPRANINISYPAMINQMVKEIHDSIMVTPRGLNTRETAYYQVMSFTMLNSMIVVIYQNAVNLAFFDLSIENQTIKVVKQSSTKNGTVRVPIWEHMFNSLQHGLKKYPLVDLRDPQQVEIFKNLAIQMTKTSQTDILTDYYDKCPQSSSRPKSKDCKITPYGEKQLGQTDAQIEAGG